MSPKGKYEEAKAERQKYVDAIVRSTSKKKIVVAGPGTGKTYLFREVLKTTKRSLTLTFVNSLVEDLSLDLYGLSDVRTLHSFARNVLGTASNGHDVNVFPKLSLVIKEDAKLLLDREIDFDRLFYNREDDNELLGFYEERRKYYENYHGYSDIVFAAVKHFERQKEQIPAYDQVLVDEFQDFNKLEVSLIDLLAEKSPVLLTGDDDQALYDFKSASPEHIRKRHSDTIAEYVSFSLPYCSRCTRVIVDAANDIVTAAMTSGYLNGRISKAYRYFEDEEKDKVSEQYPKIIYCQLHAKQFPWFIQKQIRKIAEEMKERFSILIISPTRVQSRGIVEALKSKGFENIMSRESRNEKTATLLDGLKILLDDGKSNLGWRIVVRSLLRGEEFKRLLKQTTQEGAKRVYDLLEPARRSEVAESLKLLKSVKRGTDVDSEKADKALKLLGRDSYELVREFLKEELDLESRKIGDRGLRKIPIQATTIQSSKGLAAEYVFITHFDDRYFIKDKVTGKTSDQDICSFLVALTRAKKKVFLISSTSKSEPTFLKWINKERIQKV
ncbi:MAG: AAA family ATPase [Deltaproteobacteria bacterium]|nr:AAA family ATPase [Deltaproteobacteria bacterium]